VTAITLCVVGGKSGLPKLGLERIVSKKLDAPYRSGKSKARIKVRNPIRQQQPVRSMGDFDQPNVRFWTMCFSVSFSDLLSFWFTSSFMSRGGS